MNIKSGKSHCESLSVHPGWLNYLISFDQFVRLLYINIKMNCEMNYEKFFVFVPGDVVKAVEIIP